MCDGLAALLGLVFWAFKFVLGSLLELSNPRGNLLFFGCFGAQGGVGRLKPFGIAVLAVGRAVCLVRVFISTLLVHFVHSTLLYPPPIRFHSYTSYTSFNSLKGRKIVCQAKLCPGFRVGWAVSGLDFRLPKGLLHFFVIFGCKGAFSNCNPGLLKTAFRSSGGVLRGPYTYVCVSVRALCARPHDFAKMEGRQVGTCDLLKRLDRNREFRIRIG